MGKRLENCRCVSSVICSIKDVTYFKFDRIYIYGFLQVVETWKVRKTNKTALPFYFHFRDFVVDKISELLSRTKVPDRQSSSSNVEMSTSETSKSSSENLTFEMVGPLMGLFREDVDLTREAQKEISWGKHFGTYGRGISMFRTAETTERILMGVPDM